MVIKPVSVRFGHARIPSISFGSSSGAAPSFDSSPDNFTSIITSNLRPMDATIPSSRRASFSESTVSIT